VENVASFKLKLPNGRTIIIDIDIGKYVYKVFDNGFLYEKLDRKALLKDMLSVLLQYDVTAYHEVFSPING
jgi:hypothetical protein